VNSLSENTDLQLKVFYIDKTVDPLIKINVPTEKLNQHNFCFDEYDIIHTTGIRPDFFAFINRRKIKCHISTIHNFIFEDFTFTYNRIISFLFGAIWLITWKRADKLVCVSGVLKTYYTKWFRSEKLEAIYNGITEINGSSVLDGDVIEVIKNFKSRGLKVISSVGILTKRKGIGQLLFLLAAEKGYGLVIIGKGKELQNLKHLAERLHISNSCSFLGFRSSAVKYFKYFDFFVMPSRSEGFGLALIEAVQQKIPVVCSDLPVFKELFNSDEVTFFKLEDTASLIEALKISSELGKKKAELAYAKYRNQFTDQVMAKKYLNLYSALCPML
jgi:glycosyltransferase involved in cell wall biosynthesis